MEPIFHLLYRSFANPSVNEATLQDILKVSRTQNQQASITGLLVFRKRAFLQLIEGPELSVRQLVRNIQRDTRHKGFQTLLEFHSDHRIFTDWAMAYPDNHASDPSIHSLFDLFDTATVHNAADKSLVRPILEKFLSSNSKYL